MIAWWEEIIGFISLAPIFLALVFIVYSYLTKSTLVSRRVFYF